MRARWLAIWLGVAACFLVAGPARAHPLGNFTINTYSGLRIEPGRLQIDYVVDMAEIPAFRARRAIEREDSEPQVRDAVPGARVPRLVGAHLAVDAHRERFLRRPLGDGARVPTF